MLHHIGTSHKRELSVCLFSERERGEIKRSRPLPHSSLWITISYTSIWQHILERKIDRARRKQFQSCTKSWARCILLLGWHNCNFKGKWKSSVSYPCWCCMLSCNADLFLFSRGLEIGTSTATFEVGHGLLTDVAAALHAFYGNQKTDSYSLYKLPY